MDHGFNLGIEVAPDSRLEREPRLPVILVLVLFVLTAWRLLAVVSHYSVNLIFWDQWDFYTPLFRHASLWEIFTWEHSPHREGIGLVLDKFVLEWTHWNSRAEALFMVGVLVAAAALALGLKRKLFGRFEVSDCVIPCLFLTFAQMEVLVGEENPSYSVFPELLLVLYCLAWMIRNKVLRYALVLFLNFLSIYTGFGFFAGIVTIGVLLVDFCRRARAKSKSWSLAAGALLAAAVSFGSFFYHYRWDPSISCRIPDAHPVHYAWFVSLLMSYFLGLRAVVWATVVGVLLAGAALVLLVGHGVRLWRQQQWQPVDLTIVILLSFSSLFAVNAALGRSCLGLPEAAQFSRYMGLLVPAFLAMYFHLLTWQPSRWRTAALAFFVIALIPGMVRMPNGYSPQIVSEGKRAWKACILQSGNIGYCDSATGSPAYPNPRRTQMLEKLRYLQTNRLNLYSGNQ